VLGNGHAVLDGSGSVGGASLAAAGTSVGRPAGTCARARAALWQQHTAAATAIQAR